MQFLEVLKVNKKESASFDIDNNIKKAVMTFLSSSTDSFESETSKFISDPSDIETVHKMRLEIRKIKSILFFIKNMLKTHCYNTINKELKFLNEALAAIRDLDILIFNSKLYNKSDDALTNVVLTERTKLSNSFVNEISKILKKQKTLLFDWQTVIEWETSTVYQVTTCNYVKKYLAIMLKKYLKLGKNTDFFVPNEMHTFRIEGKKIKNILELFLPLLDIEYHKLYKSLKKTLQSLGNIHDFYASNYILLSLSKNNSSISHEATKLAKYFKEVGEKETNQLNTLWPEVRNSIKSLLK